MSTLFLSSRTELSSLYWLSNWMRFHHICVEVLISPHGKSWEQWISVARSDHQCQFFFQEDGYGEGEDDGKIQEDCLKKFSSRDYIMEPAIFNTLKM